MSGLVFSLIFFVYGACAQLEEKSDLVNDYVEGYYWREYTGDIPRDAVPGGLDANGFAIYIGQVFGDNCLYPGQIREAEKSIIYYDEGHQQRTATKYIKILCGYHSENFQWIKTNNSNIKDLKDKHLILGGYHKDPGYTVYIGRLSINEETLVGMVIVCNTRESGLHIVGDGKATTYDSYQVLSYNPKVRVNTKNVFAKNETIPDADCNEKFPKKVINVNIW